MKRPGSLGRGCPFREYSINNPPDVGWNPKTDTPRKAWGRPTKQSVLLPPATSAESTIVNPIGAWQEPEAGNQSPGSCRVEEPELGF